MMFVTLLFGLIDPKTGAVEFCNAGHDAPYRLGAAGVTAVTGPQNMALGVSPDGRYESARLDLEPGEALYFFTDGITEAANPAEAMFGKERLEAALCGLTAAPLEQMIRGVGEAVRDFVRDAPQSDDITSLAIRRLNASG